ncbi:MAG: hydrogenase expression/formation protein [Candidatus Lokiarchaeota archaeon]|nr:hydrogenase expression/formation protein [Candidatus Harpocratesius repetitus]
MTAPLPIFEPGKLPPSLMKKLLEYFKLAPKDANIVISPTFGQDTGVFKVEKSFLVVKTNPVTFATNDIGYYAVILNANDIALSGATPKWFTTTILFPERRTDIKLCNSIFQSISQECQKLNIAVVAGHTEVTIGLNRPIVIGTMMGLIPFEKKVVSTFGGQPNDDILLINSIGIEGTSIMARERPKYLQQKGISLEMIKKGQDYLYHPGISIIKEAELLTQNFDIHALHGPTEGGLNMGLVELAQNSKCGLIVKRKKILVHPLTAKFSRIFDIDPFGLISSGCLIAAVHPNDSTRIINFLQQQEIEVSKIGHLTSNDDEYEYIEEDGSRTPLKYSHIDEITKIFEE